SWVKFEGFPSPLREKTLMPTANTDFHLTVHRTEDHYSARVIASPVGEAHIDFAMPFTPQEAQQLSWRAGFSPRNVINIKASISSAPPMSLKAIGTRLYDTLFAGKIGDLFNRSLDAAKRDNFNLRILLQFDDVPELAELPWEYLYSRDLDRFLVLSTR